MEEGGENIAQLAIRDRADNSSGLFFVKGDLKEPPPYCAGIEKQKKMLAYCRELVKIEPK